MKKYIFLALSCLFFLNACSSKVQTNELPNEKKYFLPKTSQNKELKIDSKILDDYDLALKDFFNFKQKEEEKNIYKIGMRYFND